MSREHEKFIDKIDKRWQAPNVAPFWRIAHEAALLQQVSPFNAIAVRLFAAAADAAWAAYDADERANP